MGQKKSQRNMTHIPKVAGSSPAGPSIHNPFFYNDLGALSEFVDNAVNTANLCRFVTRCVSAAGSCVSPIFAVHQPETDLEQYGSIRNLSTIFIYYLVIIVGIIALGVWISPVSYREFS